MSMDTTYRTQKPEVMDDFTMKGEILKDALDKIAKINQLLGGNKLTLNGVKTILDRNPGLKKIKVADVGCGNGDMLRIVSDYLEEIGIQSELIGIDANHF